MNRRKRQGNPQAKPSRGPSHGTSDPQLRVFFGAAIGPGKAELLVSIAETGSISAAARRMGMSYRRAWLMVEAMNRCFRAPLVETTKGGAGGGGARVSALGHEVLSRYRCLECSAIEAVTDQIAAFQSLLAEPPSENPG